MLEDVLRESGLSISPNVRGVIVRESKKRSIHELRLLVHEIVSIDSMLSLILTSYSLGRFRIHKGGDVVSCFVWHHLVSASEAWVFVELSPNTIEDPIELTRPLVRQLGDQLPGTLGVDLVIGISWKDGQTAYAMYAS